MVELHWDFYITRVVGGEDSLDADGKLKDPQEAIDNGVVSKSAKLTLTSHDAEYYYSYHTWRSFEDTVYVNDMEVGTLRSRRGGDRRQDFEVPIEHLRFARRDPGQPLAEERFGFNRITIKPNEFVFPRGESDSILCGMEVRETWFWPEALEFDAMSPVVMVHGNASSGKFFELEVNQYGQQIGFDFVKAFKEQQIPYTNSYALLPTDAIEKNGGRLFERIPALAEEFGAHNVHLVAHSKGGLDSRDFLARRTPREPAIGVISLTTLSTPHLGSVGADFSVAFWEHPLDSLLTDKRLRLLLGGVAYNLGHEDLTVNYVRERFNPANLPNLPDELTVDGRPRKLHYWTIGADANLDDTQDNAGRPTIQLHEALGIPVHPLVDRAELLQYVYRTLGEVYEAVWDQSSGELIVTPAPYFRLNDFAVTAESAVLAFEFATHPFVHLASVKKNHAMIGDEEVANIVIDAIRKAQDLGSYPF